ncbi:MAG: hypothetical protein AB1797_12110 [bacterium]
MMLDARCSILDAGKGSSIQDRASSIEHRVCALVAERLQSFSVSLCLCGERLR